MLGDTIDTARMRVRAMNEWYSLAEQVDRAPLLRHILARKTYETNIEYEFLHLKASGFQVFFCEKDDEYQLVLDEGEEQSA